MYYVSLGFTWLASGLLSTGVANTKIVCASNEYVKFLPPVGQSCGSYMASYISSSGGYLIDPNNTEHCEFCQLNNTNEYLGGQHPIRGSLEEFGHCPGVCCG